MYNNIKTPLFNYNIKKKKEKHVNHCESLCIMKC